MHDQSSPSVATRSKAPSRQARLAEFPSEKRDAHAELAELAAAAELARRSLEAAGRYLALAYRASVWDGQSWQSQVLFGIVRLPHVRQRGNPDAVTEAAQPQPGEELEALALINLGMTEYWAGQHEEALQYLGCGVEPAHRVGRPLLEFSGLAGLAVAGIGPVTRTAEARSPSARPAEYARQAIELAQRHGWTEDPDFRGACRAMADVLARQGRLDGAELCVRQSDRAVTAGAEPAAAGVYLTRGVLEWEGDKDRDALATFQAAERLAERLEAPNMLISLTRPLQIFILVRLGDTAGAEQADPDAAGRALECALELAEPDGGLFRTAPGALDCQVRHRTGPAALITQMLGLLTSKKPALSPPPPRLPPEPLSASELRVLRYLPTNLTGPAIAGELWVSPNTVKTHLRNIYAKLGAHSRAEAVARARDLRLLAPVWPQSLVIAGL